MGRTQTAQRQARLQQRVLPGPDGAGPNPTREITERTARKIELALNLPTLWLDQDGPVSARLDMTLVSKIINVISQMAEDEGIKLKPSALSEMVALTYGDSERSGDIRPEFIHSLLQLIK